jgi:hypothetical protein
MGALDADMLITACGDGASDAGISIRTVLEPLAGDGTPVKPATYAKPGSQSGGMFQSGRRWWGDGAERHTVDVLVIDNEPSHGGRCRGATPGLR